MMNDLYQIVDDQWIKLLEGPYKGTIYKYGRVELIEEDDTLRIKFEYQTQDGSTKDREFVQFIGPILSELIDKGIMNNSLIFVGGRDED